MTPSVAVNVFVCLCVHVFCYLFGTFPCINTDLVGTSRPHGDQSSVLMRRYVISDLFLVKIGVRVWLSTTNGSQCNVLTRIAVQTHVCAFILICEAHFSRAHNTVKSCSFSARECMFNSGLQCSEHGAMFAPCFAAVQWSDILQPWYQAKKKIYLV